VRKRELIIGLSLVILLSGCGKKNSEDTSVTENNSSGAVKEETIEDAADVTIIDTAFDINIPIRTEDYEQDYIYDPVLQNTTDDAYFYGVLDTDAQQGIAENYKRNLGVHPENMTAYITPYIYSGEAILPEGATYTYRSKDYSDFEIPVMSNTGMEFEYYGGSEFLYEMKHPTTLEGDSFAKALTIEEFGAEIENVEFNHISNIAILSEIEDTSTAQEVKKSVYARITTNERYTLTGYVSVLERDDEQYFYVCAFNNQIDTDLADELLTKFSYKENEKYYVDALVNEVLSTTDESKEIYFDLNGSAGTMSVPGIFMVDEIEGNYYSNFLTYIPQRNRDEEYPSVNLPSEYGTTSLYLKNEYLNMALTYNIFVNPEGIEDEEAFVFRYMDLGFSYQINSLQWHEDYNLYTNDQINELGEVLDKDGNTWKKFITQQRELYHINRPQTTPYNSRALVYAKTNKDTNTTQVIVFGCSYYDWTYSTEKIYEMMDNCVASFSESTPSTTIPSGTLAFLRSSYYQFESIGTESTATSTDAKSISEDYEGDIEYADEIATEGDTLSEEEMEIMMRDSEYEESLSDSGD